MNKENIIRIGIVDDDRLIVQLMTKFLENEGAYKVVLTALSGNQLLELLESDEQELPDVILLDLRMKDGSGLDVLKKLQQTENSYKVIVLSTFYKPSFLGQMLKLGVSAFLPKEVGQQKLLHVIQEVYVRGHSFGSDQIEMLRSQISPKSPEYHLSQKDDITKRELEVLQLCCQQFTNQEIADQLFISIKTVETHKGNLLSKTGAKNIAGLIIYAIQNDLIDPNECVIF